MNYGKVPIDLGHFPINWDENCYYLYLPIKMSQRENPPTDWVLRIPRRLTPFQPLISKILYSRLGGGNFFTGLDNIKNKYLYLTVKHFLVTPDFWGERGTAHVSGFGTNDINWLWYSDFSPVFNTGKFDISDNPKAALRQFNEQWNYKNEMTVPSQHLVEVTPEVVWRPSRITRYLMRTSVKITLSEHQFNRVGNSHNHLFDYNWKMIPRDVSRNIEYVPQDIA